MDPHTRLDDDDDFGGDFPGTSGARRSGNKRSFGEIDDEDDLFGSKQAKAKIEETAPGVATGMILSLRESLQTCKDDLAKCQMEHDVAKSEVQKWHSAFQNEPFINPGSSPDPTLVINYLQTLKNSEESLKEQLEKAKKKEAAFIVTFAKREQEIAELKSAVRDLRAQLKPPSLQARKLLLDPAIHEEFTRLKNLVEEKEKKLKEFQENAAANNFTPTSKMGKQLMAKCKTLQEENEEIGMEASEGKVHELSMKLALQKNQNAELRSQFEALYKHMEGLTNDVERSNEMVVIMQEKLEQKDSKIKRLKDELEQKSIIVEEKIDPASDNGKSSDEVMFSPFNTLFTLVKEMHLLQSKIGITPPWCAQLLEMLSEVFGGRIELAKAYYKALTASVRKHFKGNGVIASMEHCNDFMFLGTEAISLGRVGDDFWCSDSSGDPNGTYWLQGCHMVHCAYNSLWMGSFIHPDWDMFQSTHPCAAFHAASRAISGGPIYISDSVGQHDFKLLKSLVLPDGSILRCQDYALPSRDCLFQDPVHDGKTMLKIWNLNKYTGVLGLFNCQGGGWCPKSRRNKSFPEFSKLVTCLATPKDVEWSHGKNPIPIKAIEVFAVYMFQEKKLKFLKPEETVEISLQPFSYELLNIAPLRVLPKKLIQFSPIGLVNMLNTGGAIQSLEFEDSETLVKIGAGGSGEMRAFASEKPTACKIGGEEVEFDYVNKMVIVQVQWPSSSRTTVVEYLF
ncbi:hypothetical protein ACLB2K_051567 [Fragaria x ananassa]